MARHARRLIFWTTGVLLSLALLAMLAVAVLVWAVDPDIYRARIERAATAALGRRVELTGALRWRPGLNFQLESQGGRIANAAGFGNAPLASWRELRLGVALRPLWDRRLVIDRIELDQLRVNLEYGAAGVNWSLPASHSTPRDPGLALTVGSIRLRDGAVSFSDQASGRTWSATQLALDVDLPPRLDAPVLGFSRFSLQGHVDGSPVQQAGVVLQVKAPRIEVDWKQGYMSLPDWQMMWNDTNLSGSVHASRSDMSMQGTLHLQTPSLRRLLQSVSMAAPVTRDAAVLGPLSLSTNFRSAEGGLLLTKLGLELDSTRVEGEVRFATLAPPSIRFELAADQVDVDRYLAPQDRPGTPLSLPLARLQALDAKGVLILRRAVVAGARARELRIDVD